MTSMSKSLSLPAIFTIGVYGFDESGFFVALQDAQIDTFCDIRDRRGVRGSAYAFANSRRLQAKLVDLGITYIHRRDLAPGRSLRARQSAADKVEGVAKRQRSMLSPEFIAGYEEQYLSAFDSRLFLKEIGSQAQRIALFCVECEPTACHRSLVANRLQEDLSVEVSHIAP